MLNQVILVGRITNIIKVDDKGFAKINIAIPRSYKNADGVYETDFVKVVLTGSMATNTAEYCVKGDLVGIKGRIENKPSTEKDKNTDMIIIAEKVTFLSTNRNKKEEE